jgi:hypothetical protein
MYEISDSHYYDLINPVNLFDDLDEFRKFVSIRDGLTDSEYLLALNCLRTLCEDEELYEFCQIIKEISDGIETK